MAQFVFIQGSEAVEADGTMKRRARLSRLGHRMPDRMFASYTVTTGPDGTERVTGVMQARDPGGRRYFSDRSEADAQQRLLRWSTRIAKEMGLD